MVIQFKKYFLTFIFTVALCCGLSVSASAVQYDLADITNNDGTVVSLRKDFDFNINSSSIVNAVMSWPFKIPTASISSGEFFRWDIILPAVDFGSIPVDSTDEFISFATGTTLAGNSFGCVFSFFDNSLSGYGNYENYPNVNFSLLYSNGSIVGFSLYGIAPRDLTNVTWTLRASASITSTSRPLVSTGYISFSSYSDLLLTVGASDVYDPQISASQFSVTSTTFTSEVSLTGLDPSKTYRPYWSLYEQSDLTTVVSQGYSNQIGDVTGVEEYTGYSRIVDLKPSTGYLINWNLYEVGSLPVPADSELRFTTLSDGGSGGGSGSTDDSGGILLLILNKVSAILDTISGGESDGILASISEKLDALIDTLANPEEQELEDNFKDSLTEVNDNFFGDGAQGQAVTVSDVGNLANTQSTVKTIFQSDYSVSDFFGLFSDNSFFGWFSAETAMDLNPSYGSPAVADLDDSYNMDIYYENLEKVRGKK